LNTPTDGAGASSVAVQGAFYSLLSMFAAAGIVLINKYALMGKTSAWVFATCFFGAGFLLFRPVAMLRGSKTDFRFQAMGGVVRVAALVALFDTAFFMCFQFGLKRMGAGATSLISASAVLFTIMAAVIFLKERPSLRQSLGFILAVAGMVKLTYRMEHLALAGVGWTVLSGVFLAAENVILRKHARNINLNQMVYLRAGMQAVLCAALGLLLGDFKGGTSSTTYAYLALAGLLGPPIQFWAYTEAMARLPAGIVSVVRTCYVLPVLVVSTLVLGERFPLAQVFAAAATIFGLMLLLIPSRRPAPAVVDRDSALIQQEGSQ
jgi:O-acetylserine/cysteine efflux transporter